MRTSARRAAGLGLAAALGACSAGKRAAPAAPAPVEAGAEPRISGSLYASTPELRTVRFPYDRDELDPAARAVLKANAAAIKENLSWEVLVEGHCDERGTEAYNLALGQRRAKAVRDFYRVLGVPGERVATISYGRERPECREGGEACWALNRRAQSKVKSIVAGAPPAAGPRHE